MIEIEKVREFFGGDRYASEATSLFIESCEKGHAVITLEPERKHINAVGGLMGAVYYTMADFAFAVAENCELESEYVTVTESANISFLRAWKGGKVTAKADMIKDGRSICFYEVRCYDKDDNLLSLITINGFKVKRK